MLKPQGYATIVSDRGVTECDTFTCNHCQRIVHVKPKARPEDLGGHCRQCDKLICSNCVSQGFCAPWEKQMQQMEEREAARRSYAECS
jgi:hypothetical protein